MTALKFLRDRRTLLEAELATTTNTVGALILQARLEEIDGFRLVLEARSVKDRPAKTVEVPHVQV